jgi:hypothetical protein
MARPKGAKNKKTNHVFKDPQIEEIVEMDVEVKDPVTGKMIKQKVKVKRLKKVTHDPHRVFVGPKDIIEDLESKEDDLSSIEPDPED